MCLATECSASRTFSVIIEISEFLRVELVSSSVQASHVAGEEGEPWANSLEPERREHPDDKEVDAGSVETTWCVEAKVESEVSTGKCSSKLSAQRMRLAGVDIGRDVDGGDVVLRVQLRCRAMLPF